MSRIGRVAQVLFNKPSTGTALEGVAEAMKPAAPVVRPRVTNPEIGHNAYLTDAFEKVRPELTQTEDLKTALGRLTSVIDPAAHAEIDLINKISAAAGDVRVKYKTGLVETGQRFGGQWTPAEHPELQRAARYAAQSTGTARRSVDEIEVDPVVGRPGPTLVHEAMHAGVSRYIDTNPTSPIVKQLNGLLDIARERATVIHGFEKVDNILAQKGDWDRTLYGLSDVHEFLSEVVQNNEFRKFLADSEEVTTPNQTSFLTKGKTILDEITKLVAKIFGIDKPETLLLLNKSLNVSKTVLDLAAREGTNRKAQQALTGSAQARASAVLERVEAQKKPLDELRTKLGSNGASVFYGKEPELLSTKLAEKLPEGITAQDLVSTYFGPKWEEITDLEVVELPSGKVRVDGHSPMLDTMRTFDKDMKTVHHDWLQVKQKAAGTGYFKNVMRQTLDLYQKMGVEKVVLDAGDRNGGYTWLRMGFLPDYPEELAAAAINRIKTELKGLPPSDPAWMELANLDLFARENKSERFVNQYLIELGKQMPALQRALGDANPLRVVYTKGPVYEAALDLKDAEQMEVINTYLGRNSE